MKKFLGIVSLFACLIMGCAPASSKVSHNTDVSSEVLEGFEAKNIHEVLVLPVVTEQLGRQSFGVEDEGNTDLLITALSVYTQLEVKKVKPESSSSIADLGTSKERLFKQAEEISKKENGTPVIFCLLQKTADRSGGELGSEVASQAKYRIWLYEGGSNKIVWTSAFRTKEEAATENLFSLGSRLGGGSGFSSLNDLIASAFRSSAKKLDKLLKKK